MQQLSRCNKEKTIEILIGERQIERPSCHYYIRLERIGQEIVHVSGMFSSGSAAMDANTRHGIKTFARNETAKFMAYF
jgi:hypothetical protein